MSYMTERKRYQTSRDLAEIVDKKIKEDLLRRLSSYISLEAEAQFVRVIYTDWETEEQFQSRKEGELRSENHHRQLYEQLKKKFEGS